MRVLYFGNNRVGLEVLRHLVASGDHLVGLVLHSEEKQKYGDELKEVSGLSSSHIFYGQQLTDSQVLGRIKALKPEIGLSVMFGYILREEILSFFRDGCVNLHPGYLPFNRGQYPNVWSIIDRTPAGATLHYMDKGIDTGDLIARQEVEKEPTDTGESLYRKLEVACVDLFRREWPQIRSRSNARIPQEAGSGSLHRTRDVERVDRIDLDRCYPARELIDVIRARTFPPYKGAYFEEGGRRVYVRVSLNYEEDY